MDVYSMNDDEERFMSYLYLNLKDKINKGVKL